jgi:hypothetical protein
VPTGDHFREGLDRKDGMTMKTLRTDEERDMDLAALVAGHGVSSDVVGLITSTGCILCAACVRDPAKEVHPMVDVGVPERPVYRDSEPSRQRCDACGMWLRARQVA